MFKKFQRGAFFYGRPVQRPARRADYHQGAGAGLAADQYSDRNVVGRCPLCRNTVADNTLIDRHVTLVIQVV